MRKLSIALLGTALAVLLLFLAGLSNARRDPIVRLARLALNDWPAGAAPVRVLLMSDVHLGNQAMDDSRLRRIVDQVNAVRPDLILLAGDFIAGHEAEMARAQAAGLTQALTRLQAPLGVIAVLGNHDHATDGRTVERALVSAGITVLDNAAVRRGPLVIGGIDDKVTQHDDVPKTLAAMARLPGAGILLTHSPDVALTLKRQARLLLAGHTHCGQIALGALGPIRTLIDRRETYLCGLSREGRNRLVVTGGVGTSILPMRFGAPPDLWVITLGPAAARSVSRSRS